MMLVSRCLADPPAVSGNNNNLLFHPAAWSLSRGYHLQDFQAERGVLSEGAYLHLRPCLTRSGEQELLVAILLLWYGELLPERWTRWARGELQSYRFPLLLG